MPSTSRGYPYSVLSDVPAGPQQIQSLAEAIDTDLSTNFIPTIYIKLGRSNTYPLLSDGLQHAVASWNDGTIKQVGNITNVGDGTVRVNVAGEYCVSWHCTWPATTSSTPHHRRVGMLYKGTSFATLGDVPYMSGKVTHFVDPSLELQDMQYTGQVACAVNDLLGAAMYQNSGSALNVNPTQFVAYRIA